MTTATAEKIMLEGIIRSLRKALAEAAPDVYTALSLAEARLALIALIAEEAQQAQGPQSKKRRRKASGEVVNLRPAD